MLPKVSLVGFLLSVFVVLAIMAAPTPFQFDEMEGFLGTCGKNGCEGVRLYSNVVQKGNQYEYSYRMVNVGKKRTLLVGWAVPDQALGVGRDVHNMWLIKPGAEVKVTVLHNDQPEEVFGKLTIMSEGLFTVGGKDKPAFTNFASASQPGPIPYSHAPKKEKK